MSAHRSSTSGLLEVRWVGPRSWVVFHHALSVQVAWPVQALIAWLEAEHIVRRHYDHTLARQASQQLSAHSGGERRERPAKQHRRGNASPERKTGCDRPTTNRRRRPQRVSVAGP
jgi:hypothetical protein